MEHLSRRTTRDVQHLLIVSDPTQRGLVAAERIANMRHSLNIEITNAYLILNRVNGEVPPSVMAKVKEIDAQYLGAVPADNELVEFEFEGKPLVNLGDKSPVYQAVEKMMSGIIS